MANELVAILDPRTQANRNVYIKLFNNVGVQIGADIAAAQTANNSAIYRGDVPSGLQTGKYVLTFYRERSGRDNLYAIGGFYWDALNGLELTEAEYAHFTRQFNFIL